MALKKYIAQEGQNIFDVVLLNYGTLDELFTIFVDNPSLTINDDVIALTEMYINTAIVGDTEIKGEYATRSFITNNADENYTPIIDQKQFNDLTPFDFNDSEPYEFN